MRLRGLVVTQPEVADDFAVPANRESILLSDRAASAIQAAGLTGVSIVPLQDVEFDIAQDRL